MNRGKGNNLPRVKITNQSAIRKIIYYDGPILRAEIAKRLGLTVPTITTNVNSMISCGLVSETDGSSVPTNTLGRKAKPIDIVQDSRYFIGAELHRHARYFVITDYRGKIVHSEKDGENIVEYEDMIRAAGIIIKKMLNAGIVPRGKIGGIGLAVPGVINPETGLLGVLKPYGWKNKDIVRDIRQYIDYDGPVKIENDARARAYACQLFQRALLKDSSSYTYLYVKDGISCPFFTNADNFQIHVIAPGELGYMVIIPGMPGDNGRLNSLAGERAVKEFCHSAMVQGEAKILSEICPENAAPNINQIVQAQKRGDAAIDKIITNAVRYLGIGVANSENFVHSDTLLVDSKYFGHEPNRELLRKTIYENLIHPDFFTPEIVFVTPEEYNGARGGAAVAIMADLDTYIE